MLLLRMQSRQSLLSPIAHQQHQLHRTLTRMCSQDAAVDADTPGPVRRSPRTHPKRPPPLSNVPRQRLPTVSGAELRKQQQQQQSTPVAAPSTPVQPAAAAAQHAGRPPELQSLLVEPTWRRVLLQEFQKPYMTRLEAFLQQEWASTTVYPPQQSIFSAFNSVPFDQVRVVILGQDPYINAGEAQGLAFSVPPGVKVPSSLQNIYKELAADVGAARPSHGCLQKWCDQGVLLLNAVLTVQAKLSNSHKGQGWEDFTSAALAALVQQRSGIVFLLWGRYAQARCAQLDMSRHHVLATSHPSGLSASKGFLGCRHFSQTNKLLKQAGQQAIDWQID